AADDETLLAWLARREQGEPLAWIVGALTFCGHRVVVRGGVYVPRLQSEELARRAAAVLRLGGMAADLCTGAGAVAVHLRRDRAARVVGVDLDRRAAACARANGVAAVTGDLDAPLGSTCMDVVTAVAPYVPTAALATLPVDVTRYEPEVALDGGADGLDLVRRVVRGAARLLRPGGFLLLELGGDQDVLLAPDLDRAGFTVVDKWADEDGDLRGVMARRRR
ncbi:MAG TPA: methyltransferase domain-containing protein, partial [Acidimicrobiales bacterium]|nr:methyltransferase domain-containing protein [Acidimicrobiales bacterium]